MDKKSKLQMNKHYSKLLKKHGGTIEALAYKANEQQNKRFSLLTDIGPIPYKSSVLDVGCGLGHLCNFLRNCGWQGTYTGLDINSDMIAAAKTRLPKDNFICTDLLTDKFSDKYDYVFCAATLEHKPKYSSSDIYLKKMVEKMFSLAKKALAFDVFSVKCDYTDEDKLYADPLYLLNFCYTLTKRLVLRNDCRPYELMMYLYKEVSTDKFNIYRHWKTVPPRII